jgi:hypothetical protein
LFAPVEANLLQAEDIAAIEADPWSGLLPIKILRMYWRGRV